MARTRKAAKPSAAPTEQQQPSPARGRSRSTRRSTAADKSNNDDTVIGNVDDTVQSIEPATPSRRDATGLDLADDVFGDLDESFADGSVPVVPGSAETNASWSNSRPRSRQSSIIGRNDPPIRPSSRASNTPAIGSSFTIGAFRRRAREPSILATSRRPTSRAATSDIESETEFAPDAESTPVNTRRGRNTRASLAASADASTSRATRKRKSEIPHANNEQPEKKVAEQDSESESESELSEVSSPKPLRQPFARPVTPMNDDEIMAPPASSESEDEGDNNTWPDIHSLAQRKGRPGVSTPRRGADDILSDVSSPPSLTHSPDLRAASKNAPVIKSPPKLTTADLASLLPKRRYKKQGARDDDNDDDSSDEEEEEGNRRGASRRRRSGGLKKSTPNKGKQVQRRSKRATRRTSDKENQSGAEEEHEESAFIPLPEDTFDSALEKARNLQEAEELRDATKKFAEVDKWEMEYEEVAESFSPKGGR